MRACGPLPLQIPVLGRHFLRILPFKSSTSAYHPFVSQQNQRQSCPHCGGGDGPVRRRHRRHHFHAPVAKFPHHLQRCPRFHSVPGRGHLLPNRRTRRAP